MSGWLPSPPIGRGSAQSESPGACHANQALGGTWGVPSAWSGGGDQGADLVAAGDHGGVPPEPLQVVVVALLLQEHVDHEVHEVEEDPARLPLAFAPQRPGALGAAGAFDLLDDGADLAGVSRPAKDEIVGDHGGARDG